VYAWIWRHLPFGLPGKLVGSVLLAAVFGALLWFVVFPWAEPLLPFDDVQVTQDGIVPGEPGVGPAEPSGSGGPASPAPSGSGEPSIGDHDIPYSTVEPTVTATR
jgi:hypothetical protein